MGIVIELIRHLPSSPYFDQDWFFLISQKEPLPTIMSVTDKLIPKVRAEEEEEEEEEEEDLVDPAEEIKANCSSEKCQKYMDKLEECANRVQSKSKTTETCYEEILDFYHCVDHCASPQTFSKLK